MSVLWVVLCPMSRNAISMSCEKAVLLSNWIVHSYSMAVGECRWAQVSLLTRTLMMAATVPLIPATLIISYFYLLFIFIPYTYIIYIFITYYDDDDDMMLIFTSKIMLTVHCFIYFSFLFIISIFTTSSCISFFIFHFPPFLHFFLRLSLICANMCKQKCNYYQLVEWI